MSKNSKMICIICMVFAFSLLDQAFTSVHENELIAEISATDDRITLMLYMSADVASSPLNWSADLNEMENGLKNNNITILALIDPPVTGDTELYLVEEDVTKSSNIVSIRIIDAPFIPSDNESNMGDPSTLEGFANYCIENYYQSGRIGLIIWGHGGGWAGVAVDKTDYLNCSELVSALAEINASLGRPIDFIAFDACSMGSIEILSELSGLASLAITSELEIPASGFPYEAILTRLSSDISISNIDIAFAFADEYVKFGTLITDSTAQAAVIDLDKLGNATVSLEEFSGISISFDPVCRNMFNDTRDSSATIAATGSIDVIDYLSQLSGNTNVPRKLKRSAIAFSEIASNSILRNRVYVSGADSSILDASSLMGIAIYYPEIAVNLDEYESTSALSQKWTSFLHQVMISTYSQLPAPQLALEARDLKYSDGLNDSLEFSWMQTDDIVEWEFEIYKTNELETALLISCDDQNESATISSLRAGVYDLFGYGRNSLGMYLNWDNFEERTLYRLMGIVVQIPAEIDITGAELKVTNLRTNGITYFQVDERSPVLKLRIPDQNKMGDRLLIELYKNTTLLASGVLLFDESTAEVLLYGDPRPSTTIIFLAVLSASFLIIFALIRLLRIGSKDDR